MRDLKEIGLMVSDDFAAKQALQEIAGNVC